MPTISFFNINRRGTFSEEQILCLTAWLFEIAPSKIIVNGSKITVSATEKPLHIMSRCIREQDCYQYRNQRFSLSTLKIGQFQERTVRPYISDNTGYKMLGVMSGGHPICGEWNEENKHWEFQEGLGYRNTGIKVPITSSGIKFQQPTDKRGLGFKGLPLKKKTEYKPIQFVLSSKQAEILPPPRLCRSTNHEEIPSTITYEDPASMSDEFLHSLWTSEHVLNLPEKLELR
jgi:hypothetical protein